MNEVYAIKDKKILKNFLEWLKKNRYMYYVIFSTGIYSGLRVSDVLNLKINSVKNKETITVIEKKTHKRKVFPIKSELKQILNEYLEKREKIKADTNCLFINSNNEKVCRSSVYKMFNEAAQAVGISDNIGTHTMRKTFGYWHYQQFKDVATLQKIFNHSSPAITLRYIGIDQENINKSYEDFSYFGRVEKPDPIQQLKKENEELKKLIKMLTDKLERIA